jgi:hypothetical protein
MTVPCPGRQRLSQRLEHQSLNIEVAGGRPVGDTPLRFDIVGDDGTISLVGGTARRFHSGRLEFEIDGQPQPTASDPALPDAAVNVAGLSIWSAPAVRGPRTAPACRRARTGVVLRPAIRYVSSLIRLRATIATTSRVDRKDYDRRNGCVWSQLQKIGVGRR